MAGTSVMASTSWWWAVFLTLLLGMHLDTATADDYPFAHRSLLVDGVMSVDFAAIFRSSMQKYDATGITTGSANRILLTNYRHCLVDY